MALAMHYQIFFFERYIEISQYLYNFPFPDYHLFYYLCDYFIFLEAKCLRTI